ncbi:hypothetical protein ACIRRA_45340 [Nocardia sp. NPDC101769]|uniref:hypothetical protein n=1 Tax=Nocardia sp. NPDC101769 TaxID=3364333 RepID=UPI00381226C8
MRDTTVRCPTSAGTANYCVTPRGSRMAITMESVTDKEPHLTILYSCTANCLLYEEDPGPAELNIGSELEPRMVPRSHAWRDYYAHHLITQISADIARLRQCSEWAQQQHDRDDLPDDMTESEREEAKPGLPDDLEIAAEMR